MKELLLGVLLGVLPGYFGHVLQSKYDNRGKIKIMSVKFIADLEKSKEICIQIIENRFHMVSDTLTSIDEVEKKLELLSSSLDVDEIRLIIDYYALIDEMTEYQSNYKKALDESGFDYSKPILGHNAKASSASRGFLKCIEEIQKINMDGVINKLKTTS